MSLNAFNLKVLRSYFKISSKSLGFLIAAGCTLLLISIFSVAMATDGSDNKTRDMAAFVISFVALPVSGTLAAIAAWREKNHPASAFIWLIALILWLAATLLGGTTMARDPDVGSRSALLSEIVFCGPELAFLFGMLVYRLTRAIPDMRLTMKLARLQTAAGLLGFSGVAPYARIAALYDIPEENVGDLVEQMLKDGLNATNDKAGSRLFSQEWLKQIQDKLPGLIAAHGQITFDDLARELDVPFPIVRDWIYDLIKTGKFTGYINWQEKILYSAEAETLRDLKSCPQCGGDLALIGKGIIHCQHCGGEIFL
jgi:hypothetical protein